MQLIYSEQHIHTLMQDADSNMNCMEMREERRKTLTTKNAKQNKCQNNRLLIEWYLNARATIFAREFLPYIHTPRAVEKRHE